MPQPTQHGGGNQPRHRRREEPVDAEVDPFSVPDPVARKLTEWRNGRIGSVDTDRSYPSDTPADGLTSNRAKGPTGPVDFEDHRVSVGTEAASGGPVDVLAGSEDDRGLARDSSGGAGPSGIGPAPDPDAVGDLHEADRVADVAPVDETDAGKQGRGEPISPASLAADDGTFAIVATNLHKKFKDTIAVEDVSFNVPSGSIVAILGPNGAGKTTTVNMLCTLMKPDGGAATVCGYDVVSDAPAVRRSIMLTGQFAALDESLTGRENLVLFGRLLGLSKSDARLRADELLEIFSLTDAGSKKVGKYSGGMRRRIDIACGLVTSPQVVFLDEPTTGLDPRSRQEVWSLVENLRASGVTILLTTQYLEEADTLSDNIVVIDKGRVIAQGSSDELKESIGAAYCELTPAHTADVPKLRELLADFNPTEPTSSVDEHVVAVPAPRGPETLVDVIARTASAGIQLSDVAMRRPSLDEVFLALTDPRRDRRPAR